MRAAQCPRWCRKLHQRGLEVARVAADGLLELARGAGEQQLAVGQQQHPGRRSARPRRRCGWRRRPWCRAPASAEMNSHSRSRWRGSSDAEGSSSSSTDGLGEQPDGDVDPLLVAAREPPDLLVGAVLEPGLRQHPRHRGLGIGDLLQPGEQPQVLGHRQLGVQRGLLGNPADRRAAGRLSSPSSGASTPARIDSSVVLPAPLGPMIPTSSPGLSSKLTDCSAARVAEALGQRAGRERGRRRLRSAAAVTPRRRLTGHRRAGPSQRELRHPRLQRGAAGAAERLAGPAGAPQSGHGPARRPTSPTPAPSTPQGSNTGGGAGRRPSGG